MKIKARIERMVNGPKLKAIASVSMDGLYVVRNLRVVSGNKGLFVAYPQESYADKDGTRKYSNLFFPTSNLAKADLEKTVLDTYQQALSQAQGRSYQRSGQDHTESYQQSSPVQEQNYPQGFYPLAEEYEGMLPFNM